MSLVGASGLDASWQAALEMATSRHLAFGGQVVFTYGPLGFLYVAASNQYFVWFAGLARIAFAYAVFSRLALALVVFVGARRVHGAAAGALIAALALRIAQMPDLPVFLIACVWGLGAGRTTRTQLTLAVGGAAWTATELLEKVSIGLTTMALVLLFVACLPRRRIQAAAAAIAVGSGVFLLEWIALGQPLSAVGGYFRASMQVVSGYSAAMSLVGRPPAWMLIGGLACVAVGTYAAWATTSTYGRRQRIGTLLLWLCFALSVYKEGYVRADSHHVPIFLSAMLCGFFAFPWAPRQRHVALISLALPAILCLTVHTQREANVVRFDRGVTATIQDVRTIASGALLAAAISDTRSAVLRTDAVPARAIAIMRGHTANVFPTELAIAWAFRLDWDPIPVLQSYQAYTSSLDWQDARFVNSSGAPSRILLQSGAASIDSRVLSFDEPATTVAIFCHYRVLLATDRYAVLGRAPDRCGRPRLIETVRADWGQVVHVPRLETDVLVVVRVEGVQVGGLPSITSLLINPAKRWITLNSAVNPARLVEETAGDGLPLSVSSGLDYPRPFSVTHRVRTVSISSGSGPGAVDGGGATATHARPLTYRFEAISINPWPRR